MTPCPDADRLRRLLADELDTDAQRQLQAHLETCPTCQQVLERLAARGPSWDRAALHLGGSQEATDPALAHAVEELEATELNPSTPTGAETQGEALPTSDVELPFLDPPAEPGHLGRMGHYEILGIVGRGGMGVVLKALDERLRRVVAIKVLGPQYTTSGSARARFAREARAAAAVSHDHVVPIYHVAEHRGIPFLVMPLIAGKSLQDRIEQDGPLELKETLRIGMQTACGLAAAHKQGLVHRDIKPANILLENGVERVKITDFGLARAVDDASVTQSGVITGTPMFMSPEQARGEFKVDARSDLFSLGSVLYMMATGRPPFRASGTHAVLRRVIEETPRPMRDVIADAPGWFEAIVAKLHAKRPDDRFQSAQEIADLLAQHLAHLQEPRRVEMPAPVEAPAPGHLEKLLDATDTRRRLMQHSAMLGSLVILMLGLLLIVFGRRMEAETIAVGILAMFIGCGGLIGVSLVKQRWEVHYRGHTIRVVNSSFRGESLFIDDVPVARGGLGMRTELRGLIRQGDGAGDEIMVRCEPSVLSFRCRIFVKRQAVRVAPSAPRKAPRSAGTVWVKVALVAGIFLAAGCGLFALLFGGAAVAGLAAVFLLQEGPHVAQEVVVREAPQPIAGAVPLQNGGPVKKNENWISLFNGNNLDGWTASRPGKNDWHVELDKVGNLVIERPDAPSYLFTTRDDFRDFHLRADVHASAGSDAGVLFRCATDMFNGKAPAAYEVKIGSGTLKNESYKTGSLFLRTAPGIDGEFLQRVEQPAALDNAWFKLEVIARGTGVVVKIDGKAVVDNRTFKPTTPKGRIGLRAQSAQSALRFRKIEVNLLAPEGPFKDGPLKDGLFKDGRPNVQPK
jgi:Protein kinase domain/Domain of Unknown Function (DUF1080)